jgi:iron complex outermembrane receptor protein
MRLIEGPNFPVRQFTQADATITGYEAELFFNPTKNGISWRVFSDGSKGIFTDNTNLPSNQLFALVGK